MQKNKNRAGYKKTKVGWIPEDWEAGTLQALVTLQRGFDLPSRERIHGCYPIVTSSGIADGHSEWRAMPPGVVTGRYGTVGSVFFVETPYWPLNTTLYSKDLHGNHPRFVYYFLQNFDFRIFSAKTGVPGVNRNDLHRHPSAVPSLPEQEAIAEVLECWDKAIRGYERKIEKKRNIKKGLMQRLLSGKQRLPGFDGEWKDVRLGACAKFSKGKGISKADVQQEGLPCIRYGQIYTTDDHIATDLPSCISAQHAAVSTQIHCNDLLLAGSGETIDEIGKALAYMGTEAAYAGGDIVILRPSPAKVRSDYLAYYLNTEGRRAMRRLGQGQSVVHVYAKDLVGVRLPMPSKTEQQAIAAVLTSADAESTALESKLAVLRDQKRFLLNNMVTGTIRLPQFASSDAADATTGDTE